MTTGHVFNQMFMIVDKKYTDVMANKTIYFEYIKLNENFSQTNIYHISCNHIYLCLELL